MADVSKSSSAAMSPSNTGADPVDNSQKARPEKPDEQLFKDNLAKAEKELSAVQEKLNAIKAKIESSQPTNKDSPAVKKQQELKAELHAVRQQQSGFKSSRGSIQEKIITLDSQIKHRVADQKVARSRVAYKNVEEIDWEIQRLEKQVDAGTMKLVDEKKALAEISGLRKQRKGFAGFDEAQRGIDDLRSQISELRKTLDNPESKALSQKYDQLNKELADIKAEQDKAYSSLNSLRDERTKLYAELQQKYSASKEIKDQYYKARNAYRDFEQEQYRLKQERQKADRDAYQKEKRRKIADQKLAEASELAYMDEILAAEGLIRYFDPSVPQAAKALRGPSGFAAEARRSVETTEIQGIKVSKKDERDDNYFMGTGGKKGKKGKKGNKTGSPTSSTPTEGKFNLTVGIIEEFAKVNVETPSNQSDIPATLEKLKEKRDQWKKDQETKTKENIQKAQKEIDRLEGDAKEVRNYSPSTSGRKTHDSAKKPATLNQSVNGTVSAEAELAQESDAVADVAKDLKEAKIEDNAEE